MITLGILIAIIAFIVLALAVVIIVGGVSGLGMLLDLMIACAVIGLIVKIIVER